MLSDEELAGIREKARRWRNAPCQTTIEMCDEIARLRAENERLKAARLRSETVRAIRDALSSNSGETEAFGDAGPWEIAIADLNRCYTEEV